MGVEVFDRGRGEGDQAGVAQDAVAGGEVDFLLEDVVVFGGLGSIFDLPDFGALGFARDVLDFLLAEVASGLCDAHGGADQGERSLDFAGGQNRCEEPWDNQGAGPFAAPQHPIMGEVGANTTPGFVDRNRAGVGEASADLALALQGGGVRRVVGRAEGGGEGVHFLTQDGGGAADAADGGADLPRRVSHV